MFKKDKETDKKLSRIKKLHAYCVKDDGNFMKKLMIALTMWVVYYK